MQLSTTGGTEQVAEVAEITLHPEFDGHDYVSDLAVLRLSSPLQLASQAVGRVCLPEQGADLTGLTATVTGWGFTQEGGPDLADILQVRKYLLL